MDEVMLRYRTASFFGKLYAPELLMGLQTVEEAQDIIEATTSPDGTLSVNVDELRGGAAQPQRHASAADVTDVEARDTQAPLDTSPAPAQAEAGNPAQGAASAAPAATDPAIQPGPHDEDADEGLDPVKVEEQLRAAKTVDVLDVAADYLPGIANDGERHRLTKLYQQLRLSLTTAQQRAPRRRIYRIKSASPFWDLEGLNEALEGHAYVPAGELQRQSIGWVPPREGADLAHAVSGKLLLTLRIEAKLLPGKAIAQATTARALEIEHPQGYKPGKKQLKEIRDAIIDEKLPTALTQYDDIRLWIDPIERWLIIDTSTPSKADTVIGLLAKCVDPFPLENLYVAQSPASAMTGWLAEDEAPSNFTIDQDTELRSSGESGAAIRYVKHSIDADDVRRHIQSGKQCTRLAMTWADRISFVLTEGLDVKRVSPLDVLKEGNEGVATNDDEK
ncbi:hypothetical protein G6F35_010836 [Rhizopus arrhizus]|nr:hypothetical protein G6F35_010836 [Rhizopus arrhizus]